MNAPRENFHRHFLPASGIANFSVDTTTQPPRRRQVSVLRKVGGAAYSQAAEKVGRRPGIYGYGQNLDFDKSLTMAETNLHEPVDSIISAGNGTPNLVDWASLSWYASTLFARGPDLEAELSEFGESQGWPAGAVMPGYIMNVQRINAAVLRARWEFLQLLDGEFILPDRGIIGEIHPIWDIPCYVIPLRRGFAAVIGGGPFEKQIQWEGDRWTIKLEHRHPGRDEIGRINALAWHSARAEVYGSHASLLTAVKESAADVGQDERRLAQRYEGAELLGLDSASRREDELLHLKLFGLQPPVPGDSFYWKV